MPGADKYILVGFHPCPVNQEIGMDFNFPAIVVLDSNIGNQVTRARRRHFGPGIFRINALDSDAQALETVIEVKSFTWLGQLVQ